MNGWMSGRSCGELLALPIRHHDIELGRAVDVLLDLGAGRALGLEVRCHDDVRRFLPLGAARIGAESTEVTSPLALLDDLAFYRARGAGLRHLRGVAVVRGGRTVGTLADVLVRSGGEIEAFLVETTEGRVPVRFGPAVALAGERKVTAA